MTAVAAGSGTGAGATDTAAVGGGGGAGGVGARNESDETAANLAPRALARDKRPIAVELLVLLLLRA